MVTENIQCHHRNPDAGIEISMDMGSYAAQLNIFNMNLTVGSHADNTIVSGHCHPHISCSGGICWGASGGHVSNLLASGEIVVFLNYCTHF